MLRIALIAIVVSVLCQPLTVRASEPPPLSIKVRPGGYYSHPANETYARVIITIERDARNTHYVLSWESDSGCLSRSSRYNLEGEESPRIIETVIVFVCGNYNIKVILRRNDGTEVQAVQVVPDLNEPDDN
jgi:hypothetical protein